MEKIQIDNDNYILYSPDSLKYITDNMFTILDESLEFYKTLFDVDNYRKIQINFFDNKEKFREYIYSIRGERESLPDYATGTFDEGMINAYVAPNIIVDSPLYIKKLHMPSHELFHIMYAELIRIKEHKKRIVWFDEGMAQLFSNQFKDMLDDTNKFKKWLDKLIEETLEYPNINDIKHGNSFKNDNYDAYKLSLLAVKYLYDKLGINEFKKLMHDNDAILTYGNTVIEDAIKWYKENI